MSKELMKLKQIILLVALISTQAYADTTFHQASDLRLLQAACPQNWSYFDRAIPSANSTSPPTSVSWFNTADKDDFMLFQSNFILKSTLNNQTSETKAADPLLVASECIKRHNLVVNDYMNKDVGATPTLRKWIDITPILMLLDIL